jgi:hypothetical protein
MDLHAHSETIQVASLPNGCACSDAWQVESNVAWIGVQSVSKNTTPGTVVIQVAPNEAYYTHKGAKDGPKSFTIRHESNPRTGSLTIAGQMVVVNQAGSLPPAPTQPPAKDQTQTQPLSPPTPPPCTYQVQSDLDVGRTQQTKTIGVTPTPQGCTESGQWEAVSNVPWITVGKIDRAANPRIVTVTIRANTTPQERSGTLTIAGKTVTVTQEGRSPTGSKSQGKPKPQ